jgi:protein-arginine kinase activator protein McsA
MLCEACQQREAMVHLGRAVPDGVPEADQPPVWKHHFCEECADAFFARTPGMNSSRNLICLSDWFRSKLYDLLEAHHPEAFEGSDSAACCRSSEVMRRVLREQLVKAKLEMSDDAFEMLCGDFFGSHHFYTRADEYKKRKG